MKKRNSFAILTIAGAAVLGLASCTPAEPDKPDPDPGHQHTYSELHAQVNPTCLSEGQKAYYTCTGCDLLFNENKEVISQIESIPTLPHTPHHHDATDPSCTEAGTGEYWTCDNAGDDKLYGDQDCKEVIQSVPVVDPKGHKLSHMDGNPASCSEAGWKEYYKCDDCDALFEDAQGKTSIADLEAWKKGAGKLDLAPHSAQPVAGQASTCKEHGWKDYYHCGGCDGYFEDQAATKPIEDLEVWKAGAGKLELAAHTPVKQDGKEPTCTSDGWKDYYKCSVCDRKFEDEACETEITNLDEWKVNAGKLPMGEHGHKLVAGKASTCEEHGYKDAYLCEGCGKYFEDVEAKVSIGDADAYEAWKVAGGQLPFAAHTPVKQDGKASSCTEHGWADYYKCSVCNRMFEEEACETEITNLDAWKVGDGQLPLLAHETSKINGQVATCEADGWNDYYQCSECEGLFEDEAGETPIADLAAWKIGDGKIPAKGHDKDLTKTEAVAPTCYQTGVKEYYKCESCGKYFEDAGAETEITDLAAWKAGAGLVPATGAHDFDYSNVEVSWDGINATAVAKCSTEGCVETVSETKEGSYVKDTDATCTAPEKGHYEVTFNNTNLGSARTAANSVDNGEPHEHTYGSLVPQVDAHRETAGMKAHYQCSECKGLFDAEYNSVSADDLAIEAPAKHFEAGEDMSFAFDAPIALTETITLDIKFVNPTDSSKVTFCLFRADGEGGFAWDHYLGYFDVKPNVPVEYKGFSQETITDDGYVRIKINLSEVNRVDYEWNKEPTFSEIGGLYVRGNGYSNVEGYIELNSTVVGHEFGELVPQVDPIHDTNGVKAHYVCEECGKFFDSAKHECSESDLVLAHNAKAWKNGDYIDLPRTYTSPLVIDIKFTTEGTFKATFYAASWGTRSNYVTVNADGSSDQPAWANSHLLDDGWVRLTVNPLTVDNWNDYQKTDEAKFQVKDQFTNFYISGATGAGLFEIDSKAVGHNYGELIEGTPETHTADGVCDHYVCSECSQIFDANKNKITSTVLNTKHSFVAGSKNQINFRAELNEVITFDINFTSGSNQWFYLFDKDAGDAYRYIAFKIINDGTISYENNGAFAKPTDPNAVYTIFLEDGWIRTYIDLSKLTAGASVSGVNFLRTHDSWSDGSGTMMINHDGNYGYAPLEMQAYKLQRIVPVAIAERNSIRVRCAFTGKTEGNVHLCLTTTADANDGKMIGFGNYKIVNKGDGTVQLGSAFAGVSLEKVEDYVYDVVFDLTALNVHEKATAPETGALINAITIYNWLGTTGTICYIPE